MTGRLILVGQVAGAFGVHGELRLTAHTADSRSLLAYSPLRDEAGHEILTLTGGRPVKGGLIARAREVGTREQAQGLRGLRLYVEREALPAPAPDEYYLADLIGLAVRSPAGEVLGTVKSMADFGAGDLLEIAPADGGPSWWAPFTRDLVPEVRLADGWLIVIRPAEDES
ncbi:MAG TPA: ribosome maturation factor RimM [Caulobacteraceae bacterium]|jgi:16S rRNA processing protein RimM